MRPTGVGPAAPIASPAMDDGEPDGRPPAPDDGVDQKAAVGADAGEGIDHGSTSAAAGASAASTASTTSTARAVSMAPAARRRRSASRSPGPGSDVVTRRDYFGCGLWAAGFAVLVVVSFTVGVILRPDRAPDANTDGVTLAASVAGDSRYQLVGRIDDSDDPCVTLVRKVEGAPEPEQITAQCGLTTPAGADDSADDSADEERYVVTSSELPDGTTVVFGPVPRAAEAVRLTLSDGSRPEVEVRRSDAAGLVWFAYETDQDVSGPPVMVDGNGDEVPLPR